ncbi:MAG: hypothetical protein P8010_24680, partial [Desulfosarcinaceae bacterium]
MKILKSPNKIRKTDRGERGGDAKAKGVPNIATSRRYLAWLLLALCLGLFLVLLYPSLSIRQYSYAPGDVVERDIKAPEEFFVEDEEATRESRHKAEAAVLTVYDDDTTLAATLVRRVETAFKEMRQEAQTGNAGPAIGTQNAAQTPSPSPETAEAMDGDPKATFEAALGLSISEGAFSHLREAHFSPQLENDINRILAEIIGNGVVANKE